MNKRMQARKNNMSKEEFERAKKGMNKRLEEVEKEKKKIVDKRRETAGENEPYY